MDTVERFAELIRAAAADGRRLRIRGGGSKDFYGQVPSGEILDTLADTGIVAYEPTELYITARAGTPLATIEQTLAEQAQMLAFEPPHFGGATLGGTVATGLSGPRRVQHGAVRDFVLGVELIDGRGERLRFGGRVIKNVAGYDVSRLMAGSLGTLALLVEVTLKVLPQPRAEQTLRFACSQPQALQRLAAWAGQPLPISASAWHDNLLSLRLSGAEAALQSAQARLGGERLAAGQAAAYWCALREQTHPFFGTPLWRLALPPATPPLDLPGTVLLEWGGSQRWLACDADAQTIRGAAAAAGGHATLFRASAAQKREAGVFQSLPPTLLQLQRRLKAAFDPQGVFDATRMFPDL